MFILTRIKDNVRIHPADFALPRKEAITNELNIKYANKIINNVGCCIRVWDIATCSDPIVLACMNGAYQSSVTFRMIVFRPFIGQIITGKIIQSTADGIRMSLDFFDDIVIPSVWMKPDTKFDETEGVWIWTVDDTPLFMDKGEVIRASVEAEEFADFGPLKSDASSFTLTCSIMDAGLGLVSWW